MRHDGEVPLGQSFAEPEGVMKGKASSLIRRIKNSENGSWSKQECQKGESEWSNRSDFALVAGKDQCPIRETKILPGPIF